MKKTILIILFAVLFCPNLVFAHPGGLDNKGCHTCKTNCAEWGLTNGLYHCHSGSNRKEYYLPSNNNANNNTNNNSNTNTNTNNNTTTTPTVKKSSINTIKKITINEDEIEVANDMKYSTIDETINIKVELNHSKSSYKIEGNSNLTAGENNFKIKVTAENGNVRTYNLIVTRTLSSNTNIKVKIDNEEITFTNNEYTIDVDSKTESIKYEYELEDTKSTVRIEEPKKLETGKNTIKFIVTAEDKTEITYTLVVNKEKEIVETVPEDKEKSEETSGDFIIGIWFLGVIGVVIYCVATKNKR